MLTWAMIFLVIALLSGVLGFGGVSLSMEGIARMLFFVFLMLFALALLSGPGRIS